LAFPITLASHFYNSLYYRTSCDGMKTPTGKGPLETIVSLFCSVRNKRDHSILNNGTTAGLLQPTAMLPIGGRLVAITFHCPRDKSAHLRFGLLPIFSPFSVNVTCDVTPGGKPPGLPASESTTARALEMRGLRIVTETGSGRVLKGACCEWRYLWDHW